MREKPNICPVCEKESESSLAIYDGKQMCITCLCEKYKRNEIDIEKSNELKECEILAMIFGELEGEELEQKKKADEINERIKGSTWTAEKGTVYEVYYCGLCGVYAIDCPEKDCIATSCNATSCEKCHEDFDEWMKKNLWKDFKKCKK